MVRRTASQWRTLFEKQESSGLTATAFCRQYSLCPRYFILRKRQLGWKPKSQFIAVKPAVQASSVLPEEARIRVVEVHVPMDQLDGVLTTLLK